MQIDILFISLFLIVTALAAAPSYLLLGLLGPSRVQQRLASGSRQPALPTVRAAWRERPARGPIQHFDRWVERLVLEAGVNISPESGFLVALACGLLLGGALLVWTNNLLLAGGGLLGGMLAVVGLVLLRKQRRRKSFQEQLPQAIELLARGLRAGHSLEQAVRVVAGTISEPLSSELNRAAGQLDMGLSIEPAVRGLMRRVPLGEMRILAAALMIQRRTGGNLAATLDRLARAARDRISHRRQYRAATAASRVSAMLITLSAVLAVVYLVIWQRDYLDNFLEFRFGPPTLAAAIVLQIVGIVWLSRLLRSDYDLT